MNNKFEQQVLEECKDKQNIFIFVSKDDEVDTKEIIKKLLNSRKTIIVPVCKKDAIIISKLEKIEDLACSTYGILEPKKIIDFSKEKIDVFFVPGTIFDLKGNRKGRGKGYFDRFLKDIKGKRPIIGLCYRNQLVDELNTKKWDIAVDKIIYKNNS